MTHARTQGEQKQGDTNTPPACPSHQKNTAKKVGGGLQRILPDHVVLNKDCGKEKYGDECEAAKERGTDCCSDKKKDSNGIKPTLQKEQSNWPRGQDNELSPDPAHQWWVPDGIMSFECLIILNDGVMAQVTGEVNCTEHDTE
jgi:hypothetical protein